VLLGIFALALCVTTATFAEQKAQTGTPASGLIPFVSDGALGALGQVSRIAKETCFADTLSLPMRFQIIEEAWSVGFEARLGDSVRMSPSPLERLFAQQIDRVRTLLPPHKTSQDSSTIALDKSHLSNLCNAIKNLALLEPLLSRARSSRRSALLVVSSVACECELRRCEKMLSLYSSLAKAQPSPAIAVIDLMEMPFLQRTLGSDTIPAWFLFNSKGYPASIVGGDSDPQEIRPSLFSWLGIGR
jgi:hypothetical protein